MHDGPYHILAKRGDVAERVVVMGDPARVEQVSGMLNDPRLVNSNRGFPVYTGNYKDVEISVACHGIGGPSAAIVFEELRMLGAKVMVRLGTAGGFLEEMEAGDLVIPNAATHLSGSGVSAAYTPGVCPPCAPTYEVLEALVQAAQGAGARFMVAPVVSNDAFYAESPGFAESWRRVGAVAVEMECATLFSLAHLRGFKSGALLVLSNNVVKRTPILPADKLRPYVDKAARIVLEALSSLEA